MTIELATSTEDKLDNFLSHRPDVQQLVDKNILKDPKIAPAIQQQREELEKRKLQDSLRHKINHRPTREELIEHNILRGQALSEEERNQLHETLEHKIGERPLPDQLVKQGILTEDEIPK